MITIVLETKSQTVVYQVEELAKKYGLPFEKTPEGTVKFTFADHDGLQADGFKNRAETISRTVQRPNGDPVPALFTKLAP